MASAGPVILSVCASLANFPGPRQDADLTAQKWQAGGNYTRHNACNVNATPSGSRVVKTSHDEDKILGIEVLRFASAVAVLVFHYTHFSFHGTTEPDAASAAQQPCFLWLKFLYRNGFYGVEVFWCISGFIFFWKYGRTIAAQAISGYRFFVLRFSRLYPLHLVTLLFMMVMQAVYHARTGDFFAYRYNDAYHFLLQLAMASNWGLQVGDSFNGPIWSISIEVLAYAVFFLTLRYISGSVFLLVAMVLAASLIQVLGWSKHPFFPCIMYFYLGCLTAWLYEQQKHWKRLSSLTSVGALLILAAAMTGYLLHLHAVDAKRLVILSAPPLVFLCVKHIPPSHKIAWWLVPAGNMTYSSYLLHVPIQITVVTLCAYAGWQVPVDQPVFFLVYLAFTLFLSYWTYELFEMPMQKLVRRHLAPTRTADLSRSPSPT